MTVSWVNFRATLAGPTSDGFPGDGANSTYNLGDVYPVSGRKIGGVYDQGWFNSSNSAAMLDLAGYPGYVTNEHLGGRTALTALIDAQNFKIGGLTSGHTYNIHMCLGAITTGASVGFTICPSQYGTSLAEHTAASLAAGSLMDAAGNTYASMAAWASGEQSIAIVATTTEFWITKAISAGHNAYIEAIGIEDAAGGGGGGGGISPTAMMMGI